MHRADPSAEIVASPIGVPPPGALAVTVAVKLHALAERARVRVRQERNRGRVRSNRLDAEGYPNCPRMHSRRHRCRRQ